jgi:hypothetical protein
MAALLLGLILVSAICFVGNLMAIARVGPGWLHTAAIVALLLVVLLGILFQREVS